jgi:hypothetical protein
LVQRYVDAAPLGPALAPPADAAALLGAAALTAGAVAALLLQAPTTNAVARAKAPMRLEVAIMDMVALPPSPLGERRIVTGARREGLCFDSALSLHPRRQRAICGLLTCEQ